jgi:hypothetical protein
MKEYWRKFTSNLGKREEAIGAMETQEDDDDDEEEEKDGKQTEGGKEKKRVFAKTSEKKREDHPAFFKGVYPFP